MSFYFWYVFINLNIPLFLLYLSRVSLRQFKFQFCKVIYFCNRHPLNTFSARAVLNRLVDGLWHMRLLQFGASLVLAGNYQLMFKNKPLLLTNQLFSVMAVSSLGLYGFQFLDTCLEGICLWYSFFFKVHGMELKSSSKFLVVRCHLAHCCNQEGIINLCLAFTQLL